MIINTLLSDSNYVNRIGVSRQTYRALLPLLVAVFLLLGAWVYADHTGISAALTQKIKQKYGSAAATRVTRWQQMIHENDTKTDLEKLKLVNNFFNGARFVDDIVYWKKKDYWATPLEFIAHDTGDCEDFSIAKYFTLKEMGVNTKKMRITYVKALTLNQAHMVLAYYPTPSAVPMILDNINKRIKPASERNDLRPVYSFNADELWLSRTRNEQVKVGKPQQLNLWNDLTYRMQRELL